MKKDKKFLLDLEKNLEGLSSKNKKIIISKYESLIKEELLKKRKITSILKDFGKPADIALKEKELLNSNKFKESIIIFFSKIKKAIEKKKKVKNVKIKNSKKDNKKSLSKKKDTKTNYFVLLKEKTNILVSKMKDLFKKFKFKKKVKKVSDKVADKISEVKEEVTEEIKEFKEEVAEEIEEIKEEASEKINDIKEAISESRIFETKEDRRRRIVKNIFGSLILTILLLVWLVCCSLLMSTLVAYLDGIKIIGLSIAFLGLSLLIFWLINIINRLIFSKKINGTLNFIVLTVSILIMSVGIAYTVKYFSDIEFIEDVSDKYSMTTKTETHSLPGDTSKSMYISFNANYDTKYVVEYDNRLKDKVKIEVRYYEAYYDYFTKKSSNNIYVSLKLDTKDRFSVYLDDLKDGRVYDNDELSRYIVKIYVNKKDYRRLVILD